MAVKLVFSARQNHEIVQGVVKRLNTHSNIDLYVHDPTRDFFYLPNMPKSIKEADFIAVKVRNDCSIDLLHYAKIYKIPTLHDVNTVLLCKNKIALDVALRNVFTKHGKELHNFALPRSWNRNLKKLEQFKEWAEKKRPFVIKSHYQHDKYNRFTFLVRESDEIDIFRERYKHLLYYDVYIQKFIECDGMDRKVYVIGDNVFGIKRENPIYLYIRDQPDKINVDDIKREEFKITEEIKRLTNIISKELKLKIFGMDLIKPLNQKKYYLVDINDFPGFRGIKNVETLLADYLVSHVKKNL